MHTVCMIIANSIKVTWNFAASVLSCTLTHARVHTCPLVGAHVMRQTIKKHFKCDEILSKPQLVIYYDIYNLRLDRGDAGSDSRVS